MTVLPSSAYTDLVAACRMAFAGFQLRLVERTPSTQDLVRSAARDGAAAGYCVVAAEQTAGRGRQGRLWLAPRGTALLTSILVGAGSHPAGIPLATGLAVCDAVEAMGVAAGLKWPNDVLVEGRKLAGILIEIEPAATAAPVVIGVGVNLTVDEFPPGIAGISLEPLMETPPRWEAVLQAFVTALRTRLDALDHDGVAAIVAQWRTRAVGLGDEVIAETPSGRIKGIAVDIDDDGALLIDTKSGRLRMLAGDVHIAR